MGAVDNYFFDDDLRWLGPFFGFLRAPGRLGRWARKRATPLLTVAGVAVVVGFYSLHVPGALPVGAAVAANTGYDEGELAALLLEYPDGEEAPDDPQAKKLMWEEIIRIVDRYPKLAEDETVRMMHCHELVETRFADLAAPDDCEWMTEGLLDEPPTPEEAAWVANMIAESYDGMKD